VAEPELAPVVRRVSSTPYQQLLDLVAAHTGLTKKQTRRAVEDFCAELARAVWSRGRVVVPGLATFRVRERKPRNVRKPPSTPVADRGLMLLKGERVVTARVSKHWRRRG
jgi:nucleoid DNA-binding protein